MPGEKYLTDEELVVAQERVTKSQGRKGVTAREIYGIKWPRDGRTKLGGRFKASVRAGQISGISFLGTPSDNNARYDLP